MFDLFKKDKIVDYICKTLWFIDFIIFIFIFIMVIINFNLEILIIIAEFIVKIVEISIILCLLDVIYVFNMLDELDS